MTSDLGVKQKGAYSTLRAVENRLHLKFYQIRYVAASNFNQISTIRNINSIFKESNLLINFKHVLFGGYELKM